MPEIQYSVLSSHEVIEQDAEDIRNLLRQLVETPRILDRKALVRVCSESTLFVARSDGRIIGMSTVHLGSLPTGLVARLEDVVVDDEFRGLGIGEELVKRSIQHAKDTMGAHRLKWTSNPIREAANRLYERLGATKSPTNAWTIRF
jgi:GNAT superfamily N-acetyltransferase